MTGPKIRASEVTDETLFLNRREVLRLGAIAAIGATLAGCPAADEAGAAAGPASAGNVGDLRLLEGVKPAAAEFRVEGPTTDRKDATRYNNFYEFGTNKTDPAENAHSLRPSPWSVLIDGEVDKPGRVPVEDILAAAPLEERIYRFRCVEAWSMVIPWVGIPL
ncbi:hypothetical protein K2X89_06135, partial [Myxococcota bacterium]|nr:hypothetical protein [Myxococcota bacterium]